MPHMSLLLSFDTLSLEHFHHLNLSGPDSSRSRVKWHCGCTAVAVLLGPLGPWSLSWSLGPAARTWASVALCATYPNLYSALLLFSFSPCLLFPF